jgi:hypothetical protein
MADLQTSIDTLPVAGTPFAVEAASSVVSGYAGREAEASLARLEQIAEG